MIQQHPLSCRSAWLGNQLVIQPCQTNFVIIDITYSASACGCSLVSCQVSTGFAPSLTRSQPASGPLRPDRSPPLVYPDRPDRSPPLVHSDPIAVRLWSTQTRSQPAFGPLGPDHSPLLVYLDPITARLCSTRARS